MLTKKLKTKGAMSNATPSQTKDDPMVISLEEWVALKEFYARRAERYFKKVAIRKRLKIKP